MGARQLCIRYDEMDLLKLRIKLYILYHLIMGGLIKLVIRLHFLYSKKQHYR